ncbi:helix-turn-helix domain-containing protein [Eubacterium ramulus]|uniref:helix-turn-helix domain-containing protein n=1 Tax=Eubacterium ramulus TaxID=39490 RepID=UPI0009E8C669
MYDFIINLRGLHRIIYTTKILLNSEVLEYLNQVRIRSACDLLCNTDRSISDIAFDTGFHNLSNFNRQFRTKVGCSPQTYRKESVLS